jgi:hypothetical protein
MQSLHCKVNEKSHPLVDGKKSDKIALFEKYPNSRSKIMERQSPLLFCLIVLASAASFAAEPFRLDLKTVKPGELPKGWKAEKTHEGPGSVWKVVENASAPGGKALAQVSADGPKPLYNLCIAEETKFADVDLSVSLKANAGKIDQGGGLIWRCQDADNYYVARWNPLEDNFRVYKVEKGKRTQFATAYVKVPADEWHVLRVIHEGSNILCYLDGKLYLYVKDATFSQTGKIGLWTKADAQTSFADLKVTD